MANDDDEGVVMEINFPSIIQKLKSSAWHQKVEAFEELLKYMVDMSLSDI